MSKMCANIAVFEMLISFNLYIIAQFKLLERYE